MVFEPTLAGSLSIPPLPNVPNERADARPPGPVVTRGYVAPWIPPAMCPWSATDVASSESGPRLAPLRWAAQLGFPHGFMHKARHMPVFSRLACRGGLAHQRASRSASRERRRL